MNFTVLIDALFNHGIHPKIIDSVYVSKSNGTLDSEAKN